jgi:hypothetical protein
MEKDEQFVASMTTGIRRAALKITGITVSSVICTWMFLILQCGFLISVLLRPFSA